MRISVFPVSLSTTNTTVSMTIKSKSQTVLFMALFLFHSSFAKFSGFSTYHSVYPHFEQTYGVNVLLSFDVKCFTGSFIAENVPMALVALAFVMVVSHFGHITFMFCRLILFLLGVQLISVLVHFACTFFTGPTTECQLLQVFRKAQSRLFCSTFGTFHRVKIYAPFAFLSGHYFLVKKLLYFQFTAALSDGFNNFAQLGDMRCMSHIRLSG